MKVLKDLVFSIWEGERCEDFSDTRKMLGLVRVTHVPTLLLLSIPAPWQPVLLGMLGDSITSLE